MRFIRQDLDTSFGFGITEIEHLRAKLDQNEAPDELNDEMKQMVLDEVKRLRWSRYPQPRTYYEIKERFSQAIGIKPENFYITVGCDQVILTAFWMAGGKDRKTLIFEPTYPMFAHAASITGTQATRINIGADFKVPLDALSNDFHLINIVAPNNPTGNLPEQKVVDSAIATGALVMIDEAYFDFSGKTHIDRLEDHENILIGRSLSKSGLAHIRLGYGIARPELVRLAEHLLFVPYHLNALQMAAAKLYPELKPKLEKIAEQVNQNKAELYEFFKAMGVEFKPSHTNFVLFRVNEPDRVFEHLISKGIRIRNTSVMKGLEGWLRVTIGTRDEMQLFKDALKEAL